MDYLLDTNILIFMGYRPDRLKQEVVELLEDTENRLFFSAASVWEVVIKSSLNKPFDVDNPTLFRDGLFEAGLIEIPVKSEHTLVVADLPEKLHKDPFDRLIVAQAKHNKLPLITSDSKLIEFVSDYITIIPNR
ncbi:type II toxin-antitoxin system VapC family toxin [Klebsiella pneumoniae]|uniref:PIN domain nuclease n=4 Tax=Enterobacteriaceae TaxID=543 RepID=A0AB73QPF1_ECOLX|nr:MULTISPECIES: type II toxin-antitoxin system VapC family toxin [Enterobacterales]AUV04775.1 PIN domain nuclease [Enterobacteriaceae bacterium ENNIH2]AUV56156.1 twitching motility protein PilT [Raoultella planticola]EAB4511080.1 type II toxin-antitoxin system VapC family toxin [Salmonella enterica]EAW0737205.1 type II toxin-antitoxin system VapC family toxin [Salmonella enterica subsp. enterica serovar Oranienburg]EBG5360615.1 type II toxin-antitoxin system VapC family toxin [Salmonella ente